MEKMREIIRRLGLSSCAEGIVHPQSGRGGAFTPSWEHGEAMRRSCAAGGYLQTFRVTGILTTSVSAVVANCASARR